VYFVGDEEIEAVTRVLRNGYLFRYGPGNPAFLDETGHLERELCEMTRTAHALTVSSGTAALVTALIGLGVGPGDEVIIPGATFVSTALAPLAVGATPVIAEVDDTLTLDVHDVERKITPRTKAIIPVHYLGFVCNMDAICALAKARAVSVLEDACQCCGGTYRGQPVTSLGAAGCFSFNHFKIIACGEGGALVSSDERIVERARIAHDPGLSFRTGRIASDEPVFAGVNYRFNEILSAMMRVQLRRLGPWVERLKAIRRKWLIRLESQSHLKHVRLHDADGGIATHAVFAMNSEAEAIALRQALKAERIASALLSDPRHFYQGWEVVLPKLGVEQPLAAALEMCPRTLQHVRTAVAVLLSPLWTEAQENDTFEGVLRAAARARQAT